VSVPTLLLATCAEFPDGEDDEHPAIDALVQRGLDVTLAVWDDATVDWASADLVVVRSTWDYVGRREEFLLWARSVPRLANPAEVLAWNTDKIYLRALTEAGLPVVATTWYEPGDSPDTPDGEVVVKPTVSAGARDTQRHADPNAARAHIDSLLAAGRAVMVQPYLQGVDTAGETGLVWLGDRYSHSFRKAPLLAAGVDATRELYAAETIGARTPSPAELDVADQVLDALAAVGPVGRDQLLYARVDLVPGPDGSPVLLELELTEPSLWFVADPGSPARWADAVLARLSPSAT
jgi:hypothetical protein